MALIATGLARGGRLAGGALVATVMSNLGLERFLAGQRIELHRTAVGDRYVVEKMRALGCNLGGEQSGHIILADYATTGDGLIAALQVLASIVETGAAGERGLPAVHPGAAACEQRAPRRGHAARPHHRQGGDRRRRSAGSAAPAAW